MGENPIVSTSPRLQEKAIGAFVAFAAGDALGWPQEIPRRTKSRTNPPVPRIEFRKWVRYGGGRYLTYEEVIGPGQYSDDTQLTIAVARSRTKFGNSWWKAFTGFELPLWTICERGGGAATKRAAITWAKGVPPWLSQAPKEVDRYFGAGGNGAAMRILPHSFFHASDKNPDSLIRDALLDGAATHGHPRALLGAVVYAVSAWILARKSGTLGYGELIDSLIESATYWGEFSALGTEDTSWLSAAQKTTGGQYQDSWSTVVEEVLSLLKLARIGLRQPRSEDTHKVLNDIGCFGRSKGSGTVTSVAAAYLAAKFAVRPAKGVFTAAFENGADTDTLAAMTGGLLGCIAGTNWIPPEWTHVQDIEYLTELASRILLGRESLDEHPVERIRDPKLIASEIFDGRRGEIEIGNGSKIFVDGSFELRPTSSNLDIRGWRLRLSDGQTLYTTKVVRSRRSPSGQLGPQSKRDKRTVTDEVKGSRGSDGRIADALYNSFFRQLVLLLDTRGEMTIEEISEECGLTKGQSSVWLRQAERNGEIRCTSIKPTKFSIAFPKLF